MKLPTIIPVLDKKASAKGAVSLLLRVTWNRKLYHKSTGYKINPANFNGWITAAETNAIHKNQAIKQKIAAYELQFYELSRLAPLTDIDIKSVLAGEKANDLTIRNMATEIEKIYKGKVAYGTLRQWSSMANKIETWKPGITVSQLTKSVCNEYEQYLRIDLGNGNNTICNNFRKLHSLFVKGVEQGLIKEIPFEGFKAPSYKQSKRTYLTIPEVKLFEDYADNGANKYLRDIAAWFVLAIYSSLRDSDLNNWDEDKMIIGDKLYYSDQKTKTPHYIPLYAGLRTAVERVRGLEPKPSNQKCNVWLKDIAKAIGITKHITMHVARHTFAVSYLTLGGSIEVLKEMMAHKNMRTTEVYAAISDVRINEETSRVWGK